MKGHWPRLYGAFAQWLRYIHTARAWLSFHYFT